MAKYAQSGSNRKFLAELSLQMRPDGVDFESRRKAKVNGSCIGEQVFRYTGALDW